ncbi:MAG TPA: cobalamin-dependent protein, partial [Candidatus Binatia bacterium]|nr:cobalamin-dependent protein [Candidatus Binatia bacterium]
MRIGCVYTVERGATTDKPLPYAMDIPFGMAIIATILQQAGHDVDLMVFSPRSRWADSIEAFIATRRPRLFCLTAVSTQFAFQREIAKLVKRIDPSIFVILGGHHASLDPEETIRTPALDAICVGEGDHSVIELARRLADQEPLTGIPHLWFKGADSEVERNPPLEFDTDLDTLPYIDRRMWEPWIAEPDRYPSVLLGRGCPFRCTYCSAHAMARLSEGRFVRFRSPENIIGEISAICERYPSVDNIYL